VQNTNEILSHYLLYVARGCKAAEIGESYVARGCKAAEMGALSEAEMEKASERMKPRHGQASEAKRALKAVYKRTEAEETREYAAKEEEATEMQT
jgi:hypothetical protein